MFTESQTKKTLMGVNVVSLHRYLSHVYYISTTHTSVTDCSCFIHSRETYKDTPLFTHYLIATAVSPISEGGSVTVCVCVCVSLLCIIILIDLPKKQMTNYRRRQIGSECIHYSAICMINIPPDSLTTSPCSNPKQLRTHIFNQIYC